jgi:hypothetical protein
LTSGCSYDFVASIIKKGGEVFVLPPGCGKSARQ